MYSLINLPLSVTSTTNLRNRLMRGELAKTTLARILSSSCRTFAVSGAGIQLCPSVSRKLEQLYNPKSNVYLTSESAEIRANCLHDKTHLESNIGQRNSAGGLGLRGAPLGDGAYPQFAKYGHG